MDDLFTAKRTELNNERTNLLREIGALQDKLAGIELELGAIQAYDDFKASASITTPRTPDDTDAQSRNTGITRGDVTRVVAHAGEAGITRAGILNAMGVKGDKRGEAAVDNRLRDLKKNGDVSHENRRYRAA